MQGNAPEFLEAIRLAKQFFPECRNYLSDLTGFDWELFLAAMMTTSYSADYSCDPFAPAEAPSQGLAATGGMEGEASTVYQRLLSHANICPNGRAVVVPDAIGCNQFSLDNCLPFVCESGTVLARIDEANCFDASRNTIIVFESGVAMLTDHDDRFHWAYSRFKSA